MGRVYENARRILDLRFRAFQYSLWSHVTAVGNAENKNRTLAIVRHKHFAMLRVYVDMRGPIQLGLRAADRALRRRISTGL